MADIRGHIGYCHTHHKALYSSRRKARQDARQRHTSGMRPYRCSKVAGMWHLGHLPQAVVTGRMTATEIYGSAS